MATALQVALTFVLACASIDAYSGENPLKVTTLALPFILLDEVPEDKLKNVDEQFLKRVSEWLEYKEKMDDDENITLIVEHKTKAISYEYYFGGDTFFKVKFQSDEFGPTFSQVQYFKDSKVFIVYTDVRGNGTFNHIQYMRDSKVVYNQVPGPNGTEKWF